MGRAARGSRVRSASHHDRRRLFTSGHTTIFRILMRETWAAYPETSSLIVAEDSARSAFLANSGGKWRYCRSSRRILTPAALRKPRACALICW